MFVDCSAALPPTSPIGYAGGCCVDVDGDGCGELLLCGIAGPNRVLKWANGKLLDATPPELVEAVAVAAAAGDIDGDGVEELFLTGGADRDRLLDLRQGRWADQLMDQRGGRSVAVVDRRGVGRYGFAVAGAGPFRLYECGPHDTPTDVAHFLEMDRPAAVVLLVAPLASLRPDLLLAGSSGGNSLWRNMGAGTFLEVAAEHGIADPPERATVAAVCDWGGCPGVLIANADGPHRLYALRPTGTVRDVASLALALPSPTVAVAVGDFDNDGYEEVLFVNSREANRLFRIGPDGLTLLDAGAASEPDEPATAALVADLDEDGRLELIITHPPGSPRPLTLYKGPKAGNAWLRVRPRTRFGAPARGATVTLDAGGRTQFRVIGGGEAVAHFGLGRDPVVESLTVRWPDGAMLTLHDPAPLRVHDVRYPGG